MKRSSPTRQRLAALGLLGLLLFSYPLVGLPAGGVAGLPAGILYLFGVWLGLIALAAAVAEGRGK